jgi:hypothetical protein
MDRPKCDNYDIYSALCMNGLSLAQIWQEVNETGMYGQS